MKIRSPHFKKEFDLSKAELIGEGNFAQVRFYPNRFIESSIVTSMIHWLFEKLKKPSQTWRISRRKKSSMKSLEKSKTKTS